jgi:hypothetical protein
MLSSYPNDILKEYTAANSWRTIEFEMLTYSHFLDSSKVENSGFLTYSVSASSGVIPCKEL